MAGCGNRGVRRLGVGLVCLATAAWVGACGGGGGGGAAPPPPSPGALAGRVEYVPGPGGDRVVLETEPNDSRDTAHDLGLLRPGDRVTVYGHTSAEAGVDPFDGFRILAPLRVRVTATLEFSSAGGNDFDLLVYDGVSSQFVEWFVAETAPEVGVFHAKGAFDVVVTAWTGAGDYSLTLSAAAAPDPILEQEPNDPADAAQWLGEGLVGDEVRARGVAHALDDPTEVVALTLPQACRVRMSLDHPVTSDFDLSAWDGTLDRAAPTPIAAFGTLAIPEEGTVSVPGPSLLLVSVDVASANGLWTLTLTVLPPTTARAKPFAGAARGIAALSREADRPKVRPHQPAYGRAIRDFVAGELLIAWEAGAAPAGLEGASVAGKPAPAPAGPSRLVWERPPAMDAGDLARATLAQAAAWGRQPGVRYAEVNRIVRPCAVPDDPLYNLQWHYPLCQLPEAWDLTTGSADVVVAVLDTGSAPHSDLLPNQVAGYDFVDHDADPTDPGNGWGNGTSSFHGTHVAGTIGARGANGVGGCGVCWQVGILPVRVISDYGGTHFNVSQGIRYAAGLPNLSGTVPARPARVINMSLGAPGESQTLSDAIAAARAAGVVVVAAAGNQTSAEPFYPAASPGVISVLAVDARRDRAWYSNHGPTVDVAAPGGDTGADRNADGRPDGVLSTVAFDDVLPPREDYQFYQGTSMAAPHVAGIVALMLSVNPALTPDQVEAIVLNTATDLGTPGRDDDFGHGLVNAYACVASAAGEPGFLPVLSLSPGAIHFGDAETEAEIPIVNVGGGYLDVGAPVASTHSGVPWLGAQLVGGGDATRNADALRVTVSRGALLAGTYAGRVAVSSNGGGGVVQVLMSVSAGPAAPPDLDIWVLAVNPITFATLGFARVNPAESLDFSISGLPPGEVLLFAGSDLDVDGYICDEGEVCGAWPVLSQPQALAVPPGGVLSGLSFQVGPRGGLLAAASHADGTGAAPCACRLAVPGR